MSEQYWKTPYVVWYWAKEYDGNLDSAIGYNTTRSLTEVLEDCAKLEGMNYTVMVQDYTTGDNMTVSEFKDLYESTKNLELVDLNTPIYRITGHDVMSIANDWELKMDANDVLNIMEHVKKYICIDWTSAMEEVLGQYVSDNPHLKESINE